MLIHHRETHYSFGIHSRDQTPVGLFTVLSINEQVRDCAAYRGVGPYNASTDIIERIEAGGEKIGEDEARDIFPEIEEMELRYRR